MYVGEFSSIYIHSQKNHAKGKKNYLTEINGEMSSL